MGLKLDIVTSFLCKTGIQLGILCGAKSRYCDLIFMRNWDIIILGKNIIYGQSSVPK